LQKDDTNIHNRHAHAAFWMRESQEMT